MSDGWKTCFGFGFLILALGLAAVSLLAGGIGELVGYLNGETGWMNLQAGFYIAIGVFGVLCLTAAGFFISVRNWSWLPAIAGGVYAVVPDLILGPEDDALAMLVGVAASVLLSFLKTRREQRQA